MRNPSAYLKMRVMGALDYADGKSIRDRIKKASEMKFEDEEGNLRQFTWRTISTWLYRFKKYGVTGVQKNPRIDKGKSRKISPEELLEAISQVRPHFHGKKRYPKMALFRKCVENQILDKSRVSQTSFYRMIREYGLLDDTGDEKDKRRLAFSMQFANQLWQGDTMFGPWTTGPEGKMEQAKLIAFIDDASRVICHGQFFFQENVDMLVSALRNAFYKRGIPEAIYVDNGSIYTCQEISLICARVGCILRHAPVRDGAAKGKIERFFRTVRDQFLVRKLDLSSLDALNKQFTDWVEEEYNCSIHSGIGMKPVDRFALDLKKIRFLSPDEVSDELFFAEDSRKVKKDNTFSFNNVRYESPVDLRDKEIMIRFDRNRKNRVVIYYKSQRMGEAKKLDLIQNGMIRRQP